MVRFLVWIISAALKPKALLVAENLCLRQQLLVLQQAPAAALAQCGSTVLDLRQSMVRRLLTGLRVLGVVRNYPELHRAFRDRRHELGISLETLNFTSIKCRVERLRFATAVRHRFCAPDAPRLLLLTPEFWANTALPILKRNGSLKRSVPPTSPSIPKQSQPRPRQLHQGSPR